MTVDADADAELTPGHGGSWLARGGVLRCQSLTSPSGGCTLLHTTGAGVVLYENASGRSVWSVPTGWSSCLALGLDGDLVAWGAGRRPVWASGTAGSGAQRLEVRDSGEVVLVDGDGRVVWATGASIVPVVGPQFGRGAVLRRGERLRHQSLTSDDGSTVLVVDGSRVAVLDTYGELQWSHAYEDGQLTVMGEHGVVYPRDAEAQARMYLVLDEDGMLRMRYPDGTVVSEIAGLGQELVVVRGQAQLRDGDGTVVWTTARGGLSEAVPPRPPQVPGQHQLEAWIDSLTGKRGYCATVVRDLGPAEALRRLGLVGGAVSRETWAQLADRRDRRPAGAGAVTVAAAALGPHTLVLAGDWRTGPPRPELSAGTLAVTSCHITRVRGEGPVRRDDMEEDFVVHRNGALVAQLRDKPSRRKGVKVPEVAAALADMGSWNAATWARLYGLELMCRVAGVSPTATDLAGELLGGIIAVNQPGAEPGCRTPGASRAQQLPVLPEVSNSLLIRTFFADQQAWENLVTTLRTPSGFDGAETVADLTIVDDPSFADMSVEQLRSWVDSSEHGYFYVADETAHTTDEQLLLIVDLTAGDGEPAEARCVAADLWEIDANVSIGNMFISDFLEEDGVCRGML